jgi:hypothetical protein
MPNNAAAEKAGSAKHGNSATVRCHCYLHYQPFRSFSLLVRNQTEDRRKSRRGDRIYVATGFSRTISFQRDAGAALGIEQTLQMKAGERVVGIASQMRREKHHRLWIIVSQLFVASDIAR